MRKTLLSAVLPLFLASFACSGGDDDDTTVDPKRDAGQVRDSGVNNGGRDAGFRDGGANTGRDAGPRDGGADRDGGMALTPELVPGSYVQVAEARIEVGTDTLSSVQGKLGMGTRSTQMNTRSYEWSLSGNVTLVVWFANTNLGPVATVNADDTVLWASVTGDYTGTTPGGTAIGDTRATLEADIGMAPNEVAITAQPTGTLLQYYTTGILIALADDDTVRTFTVSRAYNVAPDGEIDPTNERIRLSNGDVEGFMGLGNQGTRLDTIRQRLGAPDAEGNITVQGETLLTLSYGFIGIEIFAVDNGVVGRDRVGFMNIHTPYYGLTGPNGEGIGSTRAAFEGFLSNEGYGNAQASSTANFFCYDHNSASSVGVTYSTDNPPAVTSVTIPLLTCP